MRPLNKSQEKQTDIKRLDEIKALNERLTLINEELIVTNEELKNYQNKLEELVTIRTFELKKKEESLNYKNSLERLLGSISTRLFNLSPELVDDSIRHSLKEICEFFHADAAFLGEISYVDNSYTLRNVWHNDKITFDEEYFKKAPLSDITWWLNKSNEKDHFVVDYRKGSGYSLQNKNVLSGIGRISFVPVIFQGNIVGFTGISTTQHEREWTNDEIALFTQMGEVFVNALKRKAAEEVLIENERNYREIFNATSEAIIIFDYRNNQIIDFNQPAANLFGIAIDGTSLLPESKLSNDLGFNQPLLVKQFKKAVKHGTVVFEWHARNMNSGKFWAEVSLKHTEIAGDLRIISVIRDITERKLSQELIRQSEERFRSIVQFLTDIIMIIDENLNIVYESPSCSAVIGYPSGSLIGLNGLNIIHPDDIQLVKADLEEVLKCENDHIPTEFRVKHAEGHWISLEVVANNMLTNPAIQGIVITGRDITERKRTEIALKNSETKFRNIFNNSSDPIVIISNKYQILEVNDVFLRETGYSQEITRKMKLTEIITDPYLPRIVENLSVIFRNEHQPALECEIKKADNQPFPAEINSKLIEYEGERALISVIRNITERKQLENRILDTIISTEEKEREKFARNLHDELGPLLSSIKMYVNSLSANIEKPKHDFITEQLKIILKEVIQSTKELSNDLSPHVLANYGLVAALEWYINQLKPYISINFDTNLKDERFGSSLELSIYRIVKELINNTIKHAKADLIHIRLFLILRNIHLHYDDNGTGFAEGWHNNYEFMGMGMSNIISRCRSINAANKFFNNAPRGMAFEMQVPVEDVTD